MVHAVLVRPRWLLAALLLTTPAVWGQSQESIRVQLSPELETTLSAPVAGRIDQLPVSLGSELAQAQLIVQFDCSEPQARLRMANAEYRAAKQTHSVKQRLQALQAAGDVEVALAAAEMSKALAAIELAKAQSRHCQIKAPFAGRVAKVYVKPYQSVNAGAPLVDLVSSDALKLRLNVPSRMLRQLRVGTPFEVDIDETGQRYGAHVSAINARVDTVAQTVELEAQLNEPAAELLAGMSGTAHFSSLTE